MSEHFQGPWVSTKQAWSQHDPWRLVLQFIYSPIQENGVTMLVVHTFPSCDYCNLSRNILIIRSNFLPWILQKIAPFPPRFLKIAADIQTHNNSKKTKLYDVDALMVLHHRSPTCCQEAKAAWDGRAKVWKKLVKASDILRGQTPHRHSVIVQKVSTIKRLCSTQDIDEIWMVCWLQGTVWHKLVARLPFKLYPKKKIPRGRLW